MSATGKLVITQNWKPLLRDRQFDELWELPGETIKRAPATEVIRSRLGNHHVYLKKYWANTFRQQWSGALRGSLVGKSKVRREYENLHKLRTWGFDAPAPVAYGEDRRAGWLKRSFLISEAIPGPVPLDAIIKDGSPRELVTHLADYVRRLHEHRFVHHDLYWRNIILTGNSLDHFFLLDAHHGGSGKCADDLAALDAPAPYYFRRTERLRFFLQYRQHERLTAADKRLIRQVLALAAPLRQRQLRRVKEARR